MCSNLSCYQLKTSCYLHNILYVDLRVKDKENVYSKYTKENEKERNINNLNYKGREREEINWRTTKTAGKQQHENKYVPINNYFKYKLVEM